jgi:hypothetical protein
MPGMARLGVPGMPHHVTQRGNRRQQTFSCEEDHAAYVELMAQWCAERRVEIRAYCLDSAMPEKELQQLRNHVRTGHPLGNGAFVAALEQSVGRSLRPRRFGRKPKLLKQPK